MLQRRLQGKGQQDQNLVSVAYVSEDHGLSPRFDVAGGRPPICFLDRSGASAEAGEGRKQQ
jgi:hypothetical protein